MNNYGNRKLIVAALTFFLVLSIGYAVFSETITIEGTATAQMEGGVEFECASGIISETGVDPTPFEEMGGTKFPSKEGGYSNDSCSVIDGKITVSADFAYPLAGRAFTIKMTNNASYPIKINDQEMSVEGYDSLKVEYWGYSLCNYYKTHVSTCMLFNYADGNGYNGISQIEPGDTHYLTFILYWNGEDKYNDGVQRTAKFTINAPYAQVQ